MIDEKRGAYGLTPLERSRRQSLRWRPVVVLSSLLLAGVLWLSSRSGNLEYPDLYEASIVELQTGLDKGHFTSVDLVKAYLIRIDEVNIKGPALQAVIETNPSALEQAAALDTERKKSGKRSALHGIPIILKDNMATLASEGMNTTAGSYALFRSIVPGDATVVAKLRKAGAIFLGKANLVRSARARCEPSLDKYRPQSEWSHARGLLAAGWSGRGGQATNPYYPGGDPFGSSSGSAIAAAIGLAAGSLGTDTHGSIVCPSSFNNLVGIRPTVGLTSRAGVIPISAHQDTVGPMTRNVADAATILTIIAGRDKNDNYTLAAPDGIPDYTQYLDAGSVRGKRFGVPRIVFMNDTLFKIHPSVHLAFANALEIIQSLGGIIVDPADLPSAIEIMENRNETLVLGVDMKIQINAYLKNLRSIPTGATTLSKIIAYNDGHKDLEEPEDYADQIGLRWAEATLGYNSSYYNAIHNDYDLGRTRGIDATLATHKLDALILPSNEHTAVPAAIAGYPIVTVPLGFHPEDTVVVPKSAGPNTVFPAPGIPFGLSFLGTAYSEPSLISFAYAYEQKTQVRLQRRAYSAAVPKTQLKDVVH
ncbi:hypothetical protein FRC12_008680 [Ceratobasidium sp. 428]|nr:hypothetical protein FRC12_008680 [Ceratobasidium sp. 428]